MKNKIALEEAFATTDTIDDSEEYFPADLWPQRRRQLLDFDTERLERMDAAGIEIAILSLNAPAVQAIPDPQRAIEVARRANDVLAEQIAAHPTRFRGFAALPMQDPDAATAELNRCVTELGFLGGLVNGFSQVGSPDNATYYDLPQYRPFWSEVARLKVPLYLHPRNPSDSQQMAYRGHPWLLGPAWGFSVETGIHALRLMASGLFDDFPTLTIILGHLGELITANIWRTSHWASPGGQNPRGVPVKQSFIDCYREHFYVTTAGDFQTIAMRNAMEELGIDRVLFSVDYPFESMDEGAGWFDSAQINENDREKIGRGNAARLFDLPQ